MNTYTKTVKLYVVSLPISPSPVAGLLVQDKGYGDNIVGQGPSHDDRRPGLTIMLSTSVGLIAVALMIAIFGIG